MDETRDETGAKVESLFKDRPSAAGLPPQPEVYQLLLALLADAQSGKITGLAFLAFDGQGHKWIGSEGKIVDADLIAGLEQLKFITLMQWSKHDAKSR